MLWSVSIALHEYTIREKADQQLLPLASNVYIGFSFLSLNHMTSLTLSSASGEFMLHGREAEEPAKADMVSSSRPQ